MSSVVKKSSHFTPKLKKVIKRKITPGKSGSPLTPPATQKAPETPETTQEESITPVIKIQESQEQPRQLIPQNTQDVSKKPAFRITLDSTVSDAPKTTTKTHDEIIVDPKDVSMKLEKLPHQDISQGDISLDEEVRLQPTTSRSRRHSSTFSQRRLSGIHVPGIRSRSGSVSLKPGDEEGSHHTPARIAIPIGKPIKRRRSSAANRSGGGLKRISIASLVSSSVSTKEQTPVIEEETETADKNKNVVSSEFVVGIDPVTKRLRKFRRKGTVPKTEEVKDEEKLEEPEIATPEEPDNLITSISSIHQLPLKAEDDEVDLYGEVEFNPEEMTMADLCKPTLPIGKVSSNFQLVKEAKVTLTQKRDSRRRDREVAKIKRVSLEEANKMNIEERKRVAERKGEQIEEEPESEKKSDEKTLFDEEPPKMSSNLQLQLTDGKIVFDEDSAIVVKPRADIAGRSIEHSNPFANPITSTTYSKRVTTDKWESEEMIMFYQALSMFGTDFSLIAQLFPYRTRKQVKSKFTLEERKHPEIVALALKRKLPVDFDKYCENINTKIETLDYYNEELKKVRLEHEQSLNAIAIEKDRALREDAEASRRREIEIRTGAKPMTKAEKLKELRKNEMIVGSIDDIKKQRVEEESSSK